METWTVVRRRVGDGRVGGGCWVTGKELDSSLDVYGGRVQLKCDGTRCRTGGEVMGKLTNAVGSQYYFTLPRNMVYPALLPLMRTPRLPAVD